MTETSKLNDPAISVFCFAPAAELEQRMDKLQLAAAEIETVEGVGVVFQWVDAADYTGDRGTKQLADLEWLVPRAELHQETVAKVSSTSTILPVRFGTLFSDWSKVGAWINPRRPEIIEAFERLEGREEWGVRLLETPHNQRVVSPETSSGSSYLMARKKVRDEEASRLETLGVTVQDFGVELASICAGLTKLPVRSYDRPLRQAEGDTRVTIANWATLIERSGRDAFRHQLQALAAAKLGHHAEAELSGPWPPYNFCPSFKCPSIQ